MDDGEEDIYGEDIYGTSNLHYGASEGVAAQYATYAAPRVDQQDQEKNRLIAELQEKVGEQEARIQDLQERFETMSQQAEQWRAAYSDAQAAATASADTTKIHAQLEALSQRDSALQMQLAEQHLENLELRKALSGARQAADPQIAQVRQLLLDPAVAREFERLRKDVEEKTKMANDLEQELQGINFTHESKTGRMLMAKCRTLQEENEEMGREMAEGKTHAVEQQAALARAYAEDMRKLYAELEDHTAALDEEAGELQQQLFLLKRERAQTEQRDGDNRGRPGALPSGDRWNNSGARRGGAKYPGNWSGGRGRQDQPMNPNRSGDRMLPLKRPR